MGKPIYTLANLPSVEWKSFRKVGTTRMASISGPCVVVTREGPYELPSEWTGYLAIDANGYPYPIESSVHAASYELAD